MRHFPFSTSADTHDPLDGPLTHPAPLITTDMTQGLVSGPVRLANVLPMGQTFPSPPQTQ